jgi:hypothetical protein
VYAADGGGFRLRGGAVQQYNQSAEPTLVLIEKSALPPDGTAQAGGLANVVNTGEFAPRSITVSPSGNVYIADRANHAIDEFSPAGAFIAQIGSEALAGLPEVPQIAAGPTGEIWAANTALGLIEFNPSGSCVNTCIPIATGTFSALAVDSVGNVLLSESTETSGGGHLSQVREVDPTGTLISITGAEEFNAAGPIAISDTGDTYVVDLESSSNQGVAPNVKVFGPLVVLPDVTTEPATDIGRSSAELHGLINADGGGAATCVFEYTSATHFASDGFAGAASAPCVPAGPFAGEAANSVHASLSDLNGGTEYRYRLVGTNSSGSDRANQLAFQTTGPGVISEAFSNPTETSVLLEASISPHGEATGYWFEYVDQAQFEASDWAAAIRIPDEPGEIPPGSASVTVSRTVGGLTPGVQYHFRAVAENLVGRSTGEGGTFATFFPAALSLPDGRAYEQTSPVNKNGSNVTGATNVVEAAARGNAVTFYAATGIPGGEGAQNFPIFLATRSESPEAWNTQGLLPPASTGPRGRILGWNPELNWSYSGNFLPGEKGTLLARETTTRSVFQIASGLSGSGPDTHQPLVSIAGTSPDGSLVAFEDLGALAPGAAAGKHNVYLLDRGTGQLILASVLNSGKAPTEGAFAGPYDWYLGSEHINSGAAEMYYPQQTNVLSSGGAAVFFTSAGSDQIYVRLNPAEAQSPVNSEGACTQSAAACTVQVSASQATTPDPAGEEPAIFNEATPDGRYALFMSSGKLTDNATTGPADEGRDLYRYDDETKELVDLTPDAEDPNGAEVQGVLGMSKDGSYVYFVANGRLATGASTGNCHQTTGKCSLYVSHDGVTTFIAPMQNGQAFAASDAANWLPTPNLAGHWVERSSRLTSSGNVLLFRSVLKLTSYENSGHAELYVYDAGSGNLRCVSCNPTNLPATGEAGLQELPEPFAAPRAKSPVLTRNLSADGRRVFFDTPDRLVSSDHNDVNDVYEWEEPDPSEGGADSCTTGSTAYIASSEGCLFLISGGGEDAGPSYFGDADEGGRNVFFFTKQRLVAQDQDVLQDMYDARVGGGIPSQDQASPSPCEGEACLPSSASPPSEAQVGSSGNVAGGNVKPPAKCPKGKKRAKRKGKSVCVKKPAHQKKKPHQKKKQHQGKVHHKKQSRHDRGGHR